MTIMKNNIVIPKEFMAIADAYEYSMAEANFTNNKTGIPSIFNAALRGMPTNRVVGEFTHNSVKYPELTKRNFMINAGLEQIISSILSKQRGKNVANYLQKTLGSKNEVFLDWVRNFQFKGDIYAMPEGIPFFSHEPLIKVVSDFESGQIFESIILSLLNRQVNVATTAYDVYEACGGKVLFEGASRRSFGPQDSLNLSRAAIIGGFSSSSNVKFGMEYDQKVGGTHGHSYVLLYGSDKEAFRAQAEMHGDNVTFLLDTYGDVKQALFTAIDVVKEYKLNHFKMRLDSGDLLIQALWIHKTLEGLGFGRDKYDIVVSDDLNAGKIRAIEEGGGDIYAYLMGTFLSIQSKGPGIVYKLTAKQENDQWVPTAKFSEEPAKATIGGNLQVYRISKDDYYVRDVITLIGESIGSFLNVGERAKPLLFKVVENGELKYDFPSLDEIVKLRKEEMKKFKNIETYQVVRSPGVQNKIYEEQV